MNPPSSIRPACAGLRRHPVRRVVGAARGRPHRSAISAGFTLTEILVAIALILIIGALAVWNINAIVGGIQNETPDKVLKATIRQARFMALQRMNTVMLTYNGENHTFDILDDKGNVLEQNADGSTNPDAEIKVKFNKVEPSSEMGDDLNPKEDDSVKYVDKNETRLLFHSSGATAPVKITLSQEGTEKPFVFRLDPFSEGPPPRPPTDIPPLQ